MIKAFVDKPTEMIWNGIRSKLLPPDIQEVARCKLRMVNNAQDVTDLRIPPTNRLEKLKWNLQAYYSIRINNQWRLVIQWIGIDIYDVKIVDCQ
ncbi:MAG: type II toxin-antitoxin system RelE/ParE family toxin [Bacteroidia bacterium]